MYQPHDLGRSLPKSVEKLMVSGSNPLPFQFVMLRRAWLTLACVGLAHAFWMSSIIRPTPSHPSYWLKAGNSEDVKCSYFSSAACICMVPASGSAKGGHS